MNLPAVDPARIEANWRMITAELDAPRPALGERILRRVGVPARVTRPLLATPGLRRAWLLAVAGAMVLALGAADPARPRESLFTLLLLAPLVPVLGVAMSYGPAADPAHEITVCTPVAGLRLVALRAVVVLAVTILGLGTATLLTPGSTLTAAAWLLPALALTAVDLAVMTVLPPRRATAAVSAGWVAVVLVARGAADDPLAAFGAAGQVAAVVVGAVALAVTVRRRERFDRLVEAAA